VLYNSFTAVFKVTLLGLHFILNRTRRFTVYLARSHRITNALKRRLVIKMANKTTGVKVGLTCKDVYVSSESVHESLNRPIR